MRKRGPSKNDGYKGVWSGGVRNKTEGGGAREKLVLTYDVITRFNKLLLDVIKDPLPVSEILLAAVIEL